MDTSASLPEVALMLFSRGGYQHASSDMGLGAGCVERAAEGKDFSNACEVLLREGQIIPKVRAAPDSCCNNT